MSLFNITSVVIKSFRKDCRGGSISVRRISMSATQFCLDDTATRRYRYILSTVSCNTGVMHLLILLRLDISSSSPHTRRRIWQEAITVLFLTSSECKIPYKHPVHYIRSRDSEFPPYLVKFQGSPGERHVENIKVSRSCLTISRPLTLVVIEDLAGSWHSWLS